MNRIHLGDRVWVVALSNPVWLTAPHIIGKGVVRKVWQPQNTNDIECAVQLTELFVSTENYIVARSTEVFESREAAEQFIFLHQLKNVERKR